MKELSTAFPHIGFVKFMSASFYLLKKMNKRYPHRIFDKYLGSPYEKQLLDRNEAFFVDPAFNIAYWDNYINNIKEVWKTLDQTNKNVVWDHLTVLVALNRKCLEYKRNKAGACAGAADDSGDDLPPGF
jgi:hypothetical protein